MIVYDGQKNDFMNNVESDSIACIIRQKILDKMGRKTPDGEFKSWVNSLEYMYKVMNDPEIPDNAGVAIEYNIPQTAKRVDFMISGYDENDDPGMIIIELKQWSSLKTVERSDALVETYTGNAMRKVVHPSYQAWSYASLIKDYNSAVQEENVKLSPCAYLHNYKRKGYDPVDDSRYDLYTSEAPVYTNGQVDKLRNFIKQVVKKGDNEQVLYMVDHGKIKPSKSLQDSIASMVKGNEEFVMIDEQRVIYEEIIKIF